MRIGVPSEVKQQEYRVAITRQVSRSWSGTVIRWSFRLVPVVVRPSRTKSSKQPGHTSSPTPHVWESADLVVKVKEPLPSEYGFLREDLLLFTHLHLAASRDCAQALLDSRTTSIAYETVELPDRTLPLLAPMSEVAGRLAPQVGAQALLKANGGRGSCSVAHQVCTPATLS